MITSITEASRIFGVKILNMAISLDNLRKGKKYKLTNHGERFDFQVMDMPADGVYIIKDLISLETYKLHDLLQYGKGKDYDLDEL